MSDAPPFPLRLWRFLGRHGEGFARAWQKRRLSAGKEDAARSAERFGHASRERPEGPLVWLHAASVGEALAALTLAEAILERRPQANALITTGTLSSARVLARRTEPRLSHQYIPYDLPQAAERFLEHWRPDLCLWVESELWPNLVASAARRGVPLALVNARVSERSARRWRRFAPGSIAWLLGRFGVILAQTPEIAARFTTLGAPPWSVATAGNLKASARPLGYDAAELERLRAAIGSRPVWLAASTHPGEEPIMLAAHRRVMKDHPELTLIVAPRHPERGATLAAEMSAYGQRSKSALPDRPGVYIADTLGEMGLWMRLSPVAVMGGSFAPPGGGHNPLEPARLGAATATGPLIQNCAADYELLVEAGGAMRLGGAQELTLALSLLLANDAAEAKRMGAAAKATTEALGGALPETLKALATIAPDFFGESEKT